MAADIYSMLLEPGYDDDGDDDDVQKPMIALAVSHAAGRLVAQSNKPSRWCSLKLAAFCIQSSTGFSLSCLCTYIYKHCGTVGSVMSFLLVRCRGTFDLNSTPFRFVYKKLPLLFPFCTALWPTLVPYLTNAFMIFFGLQGGILLTLETVNHPHGVFWHAII